MSRAADVNRTATPRMTIADLDSLRDYYGRLGMPRPRDADIDRIYEGMWKRLHEDPILKRYIHHIDNGSRGGDNRNLEPWCALGEQRYAAFLALGSAIPNSGITLMGNKGSGAADDRRTATRAEAVGLAFRILMAAPYLWLTEVDALVRSTPLPKHVLSRNLLPHSGVFFSQEAASAVRSASGETLFECNWTLLTDEGVEGFAVLMDISDGPHLRGVQIVQHVGLAQSAVRYGRRFPEDFGGLERSAVEVILQRLAFIRSPYTITETSRLPRPIRRELKREGVHDAEPLVYVVKLRRAIERAADDAGDSQPHAGWKHHWWVSGHYRAQWHPSTQSHDVIWIAPYVKGPLYKPLLEKVYAVIR